MVVIRMQSRDIIKPLKISKNILLKMLDSGIDFFHLLKALFVLLISTSAISIYFKVKFETALPLTISSLVIVFYIFGIFSNLKLGLLFLYCLIPIFFIYVIYQVKRNNNVLKKIITPGLLLYSIWILVTYYIYKNQTVIHHDDFSHWFLAIRNSYNLDQIPIGINSNVIFQDYPPGTTILAYILLKIYGNFNQSLALFTMSIWGYAFVAFLTRYLSWKNYKTIALLSIAGFLIPNTFAINQTGSEDYHTYLMVDYLLAIIFGYGLIISESFKDNKISDWKILELIINIITLILIKKVGIFLALVVLVLSTINSYKNNHKKNNYITIITSGFITFFIAIYSWKVYLHTNNVIASNINANFSYFLKDPYTSIKIASSERLNEILQLYIKGLSHYNILNGERIKLSFLAYYLLIAFVFYYIKININSKKILEKYLPNIFPLLFFIFIFLIGHFIMYAFIFGDGESFGLSSFLRYLLFITAGVFIFLIDILIKNGFKFNSINSRIFLYFIMSIVILNAPSYETKKHHDFYKLKESIKSDLMKIEKGTQNQLSINWAKTKLNQIENNDFNNFEDLGLINRIAILSSEERIASDDKNLQKFIKILHQYNNIDGLCFIEGKEGTSYGHALMVRNEMAPLQVRRILTYNYRDINDINIHKSQFLAEIKNCTEAFVIEPNKILSDQYGEYFTSKIVSLGLYHVYWKSKNMPQLKLINCDACNTKQN
jgi:hypothetical protein